MHIAYSALSPNVGTTDNSFEQENEIKTRYEAYLATCYKYREQIKEIQQYMPGWTPKFHH